MTTSVSRRVIEPPGTEALRLPGGAAREHRRTPNGRGTHDTLVRLHPPHAGAAR